MTVVTRDEITKQKPEKSLVESKQRTGGRNSTGRVTSRFIGGGAKQAYRVVDFKRDKTGIPAVVASIEYDPNRSSRIALLHYADGEKRYILQPDGLKVGYKVMSGPQADILSGQRPAAEEYARRHGRPQHRAEARQGRRRWRARPVRRRNWFRKRAALALLKLPSGEVRRVPLECMATVGQVGNTDHENVSPGKAGRTRWLGKMPHNRGVSMNPVDHPHGGGEGQDLGRPASGDAVGPAHARIQDPQQQAHG